MIEYLLKTGLFRNANHAIWFSFSIFFLLFFLLNQWGGWGKIILVLPIIWHASPLLHGLRIVRRNEVNEIYSADCIWFNTLMVGTYGFLMYIL